MLPCMCLEGNDTEDRFPAFNKENHALITTLQSIKSLVTEDEEGES